MAQKITLSKKDKEKGLRIPSSLSSDLAYLIGVFAGDGSMGYRPVKHEYWFKCVGNPKDERLFYDVILSQIFRNVFGFFPLMRTHDKTTTYGFRLYSKSLVFYLTLHRGLPLGKKYSSLKIPPDIAKNKTFLCSFLRGLFDTDGSMIFKKRYRQIPYYPVISFASKSKEFTRQVHTSLENLGFRVVGIYDYKIIDKRFRRGYSVINRLELNGMKNLDLWIKEIGFSSPKHLEKIKKWKK